MADDSQDQGGKKVASSTSSTTVDKPVKPDYFRVVTALSAAGGEPDRVLFRSVSEKRARKWLEDHAPRGGDILLSKPDGNYETYAQERTGEKGADVDLWQPFDPQDYTRPEQASEVAPDEWADVEV
jgi:hypothetical protein